ncbi:MAG TPA: glycerol-3-phosphate acyltransferase [Verrucomicrobiae bacterium]
MSWLERILGPPANWDQAFLIALGCYLLGCVTAGYYLVRLRTGRDMRQIGSGSVGARNVSAVLGPSGFMATLLFDIAKGCGAVWAVRKYSGDERLVALAMLAVVVGHIWPVQLRFRGGKGVATSLGALLIYDWRLVIAYGLLFLLPFACLRKTVLPGLIAYGLLPLASFFLKHDGIKLTVVSFLVAFILIAHRRNLVKEFDALIARTPADEAKADKP